MTTYRYGDRYAAAGPAKGAGAEWKNGMAWALIGRLTSSMLLHLL
jgi:hypothetical protein